MNAVCVTGLFYGDEGKGTVTAYLAEDLPDVRVVVRHSGGCQAAHNVVTADGRHHTFAQFGSGTFTAGVRTHLAHSMMVNPFNVYDEAHHLQSIGVSDAFHRLSVDRDCLVTTPMHAQANNWRERLRGSDAHGTCGLGIGETRWWHNEAGEDALFVRDLSDRSITKDKLQLLQTAYLADIGIPFTMPNDDDLDLYVDFVHRALIVSRDELAGIVGDGTVIFEGAQGVLLDEKHGFQPHTTWSTTTSENARKILRDDLRQNPDDAMYIGVTRTYSTRHGAGPFPPGVLPVWDESEEHNNSDGQQGVFRTGPWDQAIAKYVVDIDPPTHLAVTHCDRIGPHLWSTCSTYTANFEGDFEFIESKDALEFISTTLHAPVLIESHGPRTDQKKTLSLV